MPQPTAGDDWDGPFVLAALVCQDVSPNTEGAWSISGIANDLAVPAPVAPGAVAPAKLVLLFARGAALGEYALSLVVTDPAGDRIGVPGLRPLLFRLGAPTLRVVLSVGIPIGEQGPWWYEVRLRERLMTRIPFRVRHDEATGGDARTG